MLSRRQFIEFTNKRGNLKKNELKVNSNIKSKKDKLNLKMLIFGPTKFTKKK